MTMIVRAGLLLLVMTLLTGLLYPLLITGIAQGLFAHKANGSLLLRQGEWVGSKRLAQSFKSQKYFWPRPSAIDYNPLPSGGSNLGPTSAILVKQVAERRAFLTQAHQLPSDAYVPEDLLFASSSGLDPHISIAAVYFQLARVARARGWNDAQIQDIFHLIESLVAHHPKVFPGDAGVNVLVLNLAIDGYL